MKQINNIQERSIKEPTCDDKIVFERILHDKLKLNMIAMELTKDVWPVKWAPFMSTHKMGHLENQSSVKQASPERSTASHSHSPSPVEKIILKKRPGPKEKAQERPAPGDNYEEGLAMGESIRVKGRGKATC